MTKEDQKLMREQDEKTLAQWWCALNRWEWPEKIPNEEARQDRDGGRRSSIMNWISAQIGAEACNREWNIDDMTDEEHQAFWARG